MKTLRTKEAVRILKDIFETDKYKSKADKAETVRDFIRTYGFTPLERVCEKYFDEVFPDWFEDFVVKEWDYKVSKDVYAQNEWNKEN